MTQRHLFSRRVLSSRRHANVQVLSQQRWGSTSSAFSKPEQAGIRRCHMACLQRIVEDQILSPSVPPPLPPSPPLINILTYTPQIFLRPTIAPFENSFWPLRPLFRPASYNHPAWSNHKWTSQSMASHFSALQTEKHADYSHCFYSLPMILLIM